MNFVLGKWEWKVGKLEVAGFVDGVRSPVCFADDDDGLDGSKTGWLSSGSANFRAVEPRPWRAMIVVLWVWRGGKISGGEVLGDLGVLDFEDDMFCGIYFDM